MTEENTKLTGIYPKLHFGKVALRESVHQEWSAKIPAGIPVEALTSEGYWTHHANSFKPLDRLEAFSEDGLWEASYRVLRVEGPEVFLARLSYSEYEKVTAKGDGDPYIVKWRSPACKWAVQMTSDGKVVKENFDSKEAAEEFKATLKPKAA